MSKQDEKPRKIISEKEILSSMASFLRAPGRPAPTPKGEDFIFEMSPPPIEIGLPRTISVYGFSLGTAQDFIEKLNEFYRDDPKAPVLILIMSYGGDVDGLMAMIGAIETSPLPEIRTCGAGIAASCAAILLSCGTKGSRFVLPHTRILVHEIWGWNIGSVSDQENDLDEMKRLNQEALGILAANSGVSIDELMNEVAGMDRYFTAEGAVQFGMIDSIVTNLDELIPQPTEKEPEGVAQVGEPEPGEVVADGE